jgi:signal peptidase I
MSKIGSFLKETITTILLALILALFIRAYVVEARVIPSGSMLPTIEEGDRVLVNKIVYHMRQPDRGEIIVFEAPITMLETQDDFIKRVIGVPGDSIEVKNGTVYVNGEALEEDYIAEHPNYVYGPVKVPEDALFVMGDNRNSSYDSHMWDSWLRLDKVKGEAFVRYWPPHRIGKIE